MCGIGVLSSKSSTLDPSSMIPFMEKIKHRGPDSQNITPINPSLIFANNRLAVIDNNERANQPFSYKHLTITFNGAIYNYLELQSTLSELGHSFHTQSDTEVILHAYEEYGPDCLNMFNGMWAFVIHDSRTNTLFAARDRFAIKPLYYYHSKEFFHIASEIKQFKCLENLDLSYNKKRIVEYFNSGGFSNFDYKTFFNEIFQLEGGTYLILDLETYDKSLYKFYDFKDEKGQAFEEIEEVKSMLEDSVSLRLRADHKIATTLSGGIDSSILAYEMMSSKKENKEENSSPINSYSFIELKDSAMNEEEFIKSFILQYPHANHQVLLPAKLDELIKECIYYQDEPPASLSTIAQFLVYKLAKNNKEKVLFSGQGADEIFGGYPRFATFIPFLKRILFIRNYFKLISNLIKKRNHKNEKLFNFETASSVPTKSSEYSKSLLKEKGLRDLLHYEDRNSMANSIESRLPFLDYRLVEKTINSTDKFKFDWSRLKAALLKTYANILPRSILNKIEKTAFDTPEKLLLDEGFFNVDDEYHKLKNALPDLPWNNKINLKAVSEFTAWQIYFMNIFLEIELK